MAPSQPKGMPVETEAPMFPFQSVCADHFALRGKQYLVVVDRFSGWPSVFYCGDTVGTSRKVIEVLREYFGRYGVPEVMSTDGAPNFVSYKMSSFLARYGVKHRISSAMYPHSNMRAELGVRSMKRLCRENTTACGGLNTDQFLRAILTYRQTPDRDMGRSPSEVLFGKQLRDHLPGPVSKYVARPEWGLLQKDREEALAKRAVKCEERMLVGAKELTELKVGATVRIQNQVGDRSTRWDKTGVVVETKPYQQYLVKVDGSGRLTLRNRRFLREIIPFGDRRTIWKSQNVSKDNEIDVNPEQGDYQRPVRSRKPVDRLVVTGGGKSYNSEVSSVCATSDIVDSVGGGGDIGESGLRASLSRL